MQPVYELMDAECSSVSAFVDGGGLDLSVQNGIDTPSAAKRTGTDEIHAGENAQQRKVRPVGLQDVMAALAKVKPAAEDQLA